MSDLPDVLWLSTSTSLKQFDLPLLNYLPHWSPITLWQYHQSQDEANSIETAIALLHDYLEACNRSFHLVGHGTSGLLGLLYARRYPDRVKSLSLLAVGAWPAVDWQAHYYARYHFLPCGRKAILVQMARHLFGYEDKHAVKYLAGVLERDLDRALSPHSLFRQASIEPAGVPVPLLVCGSQDDFIVEPKALQAWRPWLKERDRIWQCPSGRYFFHYFHPRLVAWKLIDFWQSMSAIAGPSLIEMLR